jgi:Spy/CpxP family protein refolding chaperone
MRRGVLHAALGAWIAAASVTVSDTARAQRPDSGAVRPRAGRLGRGNPARVEQRANRPLTPRQQLLQQRVRQAFDGVVRRQLSLNDEQVKRLSEVDRQYQVQRNQVNRDEREARLALREALEDSSRTPDQAKVDGYMSRLVKAQHRRAEILEAEQKDLSTFLTPVQRAKYFALRDQLTRRIQEIVQDSIGRGGARRPK